MPGRRAPRRRGGVPMNALTYDTATATVAAGRTGMRRLISPWGFRHLRAVAGIRFAVGLLLTVLGSLDLLRSYAGAGSVAAALFAVAALHFGLGAWQLVVARSGE